MYAGSESTLTSTTRTVAPTCRASTFAAAPPVAKLATIWAVTSGGYADVPAVRATPWSPAKMTRAGRANGAGGQVRCTAQSQMDRSSSCPSAPAGLVSVRCRATAAARAARRGW